MKALVTGGAGFIGSHLVEQLLNDGYEEVIAIDDLSTGSIDNLKGIKNAKLIVGDILDTKLMEKWIQYVDVVFHLAAVVGVDYVIKNPLKETTVNFFGTMNVIKYCEQYKKKLLFTSSSEIYGKNSSPFIKENADRILGNITETRWCYSMSKAYSEFLILKMNSEKVIVRLFNTSGARQVGTYGMVLPKFVKQAMHNKPITVYNLGNQIRCFIHVKEVVYVLSRLMEEKKSDGQIFNVGSEDSITIIDLAKRVKKLLKSKSEIVFVSPDKIYDGDFVECKQRIPNTDKIREFLNYYEQKRNLNDIIMDIKNEENRKNNHKA